MNNSEFGFFGRFQLKIFNNLTTIEMSVLFILMCCLLLDNFYKTHLIKTFSFGVLLVSYLSILKFNNDESKTNAVEYFVNTLSKYAILAVCFGFMFYLMNWQNPPFIAKPAGVMIVMCFIAFLIFKNKNPYSTLITNVVVLRSFVFSGLSVWMFLFP